MKHMLIRYALAVRKRIWLLLFIMIFAVGTSYVMTKKFVESEFTATAKLIVNIKPTASQDTFLNDVMGYAKMNKTYAEMIKSESLAADVIAKLRLPLSAKELVGLVTVQSVTDTQIITITVRHPNDKLVPTIADEFARAFISKAAKLMQVDNVTILDRASGQPVSRTKPNMKFNLVVAFGLAVGGGIAAIVVREYFDPRIKTRGEIKALLGLPLVGEVGNGNNPKDSSRMFLNFQSLYRNLVPLHLLHGKKTMVVTSTVRGEGKTTILARYGVLLAQSGHNVLLLDADVEGAGLGEKFRLQGASGLSDLLDGRVDRRDALHGTEIAGLTVLPTGRVTHTAMRALGGEPLRELLAGLRDEYDIVLIDAPALDGSLVPQVLAPLADGTLFVVGSGMVHRELAIMAVETLMQTDAHLVGAVLNNIEGKTAHPLYFLERTRAGAEVEF